MRPLYVCAGVLFLLTLRAHANSYSEDMNRPIKALSGEQVQALMRGDGMGMALPAELNGYPGPKHVLEHAEQMQLTVEQQHNVTRVFQAMQMQAQALGRDIVKLERTMDQAFAGAHAEDDEIKRMSLQIAELYGRLRHAHLAAHLTVRKLLSEAQLLKYAALRGYAKQTQDHAHHPDAHD